MSHSERAVRPQSSQGAFSGAVFIYLELQGVGISQGFLKQLPWSTDLMGYSYVLQEKRFYVRFIGISRHFADTLVLYHDSPRAKIESMGIPRLTDLFGQENSYSCSSLGD